MTPGGGLGLPSTVRATRLDHRMLRGGHEERGAVAHHHEFRRRAAQLPRDGRSDRASRRARRRVQGAGHQLALPAEAARPRRLPRHRVRPARSRGLGDRRGRAHDGPPRCRPPRPARRARARGRHPRGPVDGRQRHLGARAAVRHRRHPGRRHRRPDAEDAEHGRLGLRLLRLRRDERRHLLRDRHPRSRSPSREVEGPRAHLTRAEGDGPPEGRAADVHRGRARAAERPRQARLARLGRGARSPRPLHRRRRERVLAGRARRGIRGPERARRRRRSSSATATPRTSSSRSGSTRRCSGSCSAEVRAPASIAAPGAHCRARTHSHASRCARCTASPIHSELSYTRSGPRRSSRPPAASWSASRSPATTTQSVEPCCSSSSR